MNKKIYKLRKNNLIIIKILKKDKLKKTKKTIIIL